MQKLIQSDNIMLVQQVGQNPPYDDRYVLDSAALLDAIIVSNDQYRDLIYEKKIYQRMANENTLTYNWFGDAIMFPVDPRGRDGPDLTTFLHHT